MTNPIDPARCFLVLLLFTGACGTAGSPAEPEFFGGLPVFPSSATRYAAASDAPVAIGPRWLAYLADEADSGKTDLNGDGDTLDRVAVAFELRRRVATALRAAREVCVLEDEIYATTREDEDGRDWSGDGTLDDLVLLHWSAASAAVAFVAAVEESPLTAIEDRFYFCAAGEGLAAIPGATKLHWVSAGAPTAPVPVLAGSSEFGVDPRPLFQEEGLLFLLQDERAEGRDLNADGDAGDERVLALLDALDPAAPVRNVGLALGANTPVRAQRVSGADWLVGFLVDERAQGNVNLNDSAAFAGRLQPAHCLGREDTDADDQVLHFLFHGPWSQESELFPPLNTGLAGCARVFAQESQDGARFLVGTIVPETAEGLCSLNGDGDQDDRVLSWVEVAPAEILARPVPRRFVALHDAPGGAHGVVELDAWFVAVLSESEDGNDFDGDATNALNLLAVIDPFRKQGNPEDWGVSQRAVDSLAIDPDRRALTFCVREREDASCNDDGDLDDSFAMFGRREPDGFLRWRGYCYATERFNAGQVLIGDVAFFRADEAEEGKDINEDGDRFDQVLVRHSVFPLGRPYYVGTLNHLPVSAVMRGQGDVAAYLEDEAQSGKDANDDGDATDSVLRTVSAR